MEKETEGFTALGTSKFGLTPLHMQTLLAVVGEVVLFEVIKVTGIEGEMQAE